ncbi:MAG: putative transporter substrate binding protein [Fibrobacteres bacterium]|nr:putative transporter substrate binding protein [Fibrobacterota bacterium]
MIFLACLGLACGLGGLHFFRDSGGAAPALSILTPHGDNIRQEVGAAFKAWSETRYGESPDINWIDQGGTSEDLRYVQSRFAKSSQGAVPGSIGIDLFFGGGTPPFRTLAREGLLQGHTVPARILEEVPITVSGTRVYSDSEGWYGVALSSFGILYNRTLLAEKGLPLPVSWTDLAEPKADRWVASVDPRGSGSAHVIYEIILQKYGWDAGWRLLARIAANSGHFTKGASAVLPLVSTGEAAYTVAIDQYAWSLIEKLGAGRVGFALPAGETVTTPDPVAMLKGAPHAVTAARFMEFLLSEPCQLLWGLKAGVPNGPAHLSLNRMSVLPKVAAKLDSTNSFVRGNPFLEAVGMSWTYSDSLTESRWALVNDALGLWMVDSHEAAHRDWQAINARTPKAADLDAWEAALAGNRYFRPPAPWEEMRGLAARWKDETFRNGTMARWARELND